jgi:putative membrane protein
MRNSSFLKAAEIVGAGTAAAMGVILDLTPASVWAGSPSEPYEYGYGPHMMWGGGYGMIFGPLVMILVLAVMIAAVVLIVRWIGGPWHGAAPSHHAPSVRTPLDVLKERFARGEIEKEEFEERRRLLGD